MKTISGIADDFMEEAAQDYIGLWAIVSNVRRDLGLSNNVEVKARTLDVVRILLDRGLFPGDYLKTGFRFWDEPGVAAAIARIDKEWDTAKGDPSLGVPICWFDMKRP